VYPPLTPEHSQSQFILRPTVSRPVCLGVKQTRYLLLPDSFGFAHVGQILWREDGSVVYNSFWPSPEQSYLAPIKSSDHFSSWVLIQFLWCHYSVLFWFGPIELCHDLVKLCCEYCKHGVQRRIDCLTAEFPMVLPSTTILGSESHGAHDQILHSGVSRSRQTLSRLRDELLICPYIYIYIYVYI
jgi:hypothetical protein